MLNKLHVSHALDVVHVLPPSLVEANHPEPAPAAMQWLPSTQEIP
jgi:hypothetical protein